MTKKRKNTTAGKRRDDESETSFGTEQLQAKASQTTGNTFSQMLSRSM